AQAENMVALRPEDIEELARTDNLFKKYAAARRQGAMTSSAANIAVEAEIKRLSNTFPMLGPQVKQAASRRLGFDPTGAQYKFRVNPYPSGKQSLTPVQQIVQNSQQLATQLGADPQEMTDAMLQNYYLKQTNLLRKQSQQAGTQQATDVVNGALDSAQDSILDSTMHMVQIASQQDGIISDKDMQKWTMQINVEKQQAVRQLQNQLSHTDLTSKQRADAVDRLQSKYDDQVTLLNMYKGSKTLQEREQ